MVRMRPERFPLEIAKKITHASAGPFQILKKINSNAYVVDLLPDFGINCTFNVEDLVSYRATFNSLSDPFVDEPTQDLLSVSPPLPPLPLKLPYTIENIDSILNDQIVSTRDGGTRHYLIKWKGRPDSENSWITEEDFRHLDPDILERHQSQQQLPPHTLKRVEFLPLGGN